MTVDGGDTRDRLLGLGEATGSTTDKAPSLSQQTRAALGTDQSDPFEKYFKQFKDYSSEERKKAQEAQKSIIETQSKMEGEALRQQSDLAQKQANEMSGIISSYGKQLMAPAPKREIDPQTKEGMMGLAAILPVAGAFFGGKGLTSATGAMQAMTGLVKGYQEGNKERIAFEQKKYDDAMKEFDRHQKQIREAFELAIKGAQVNQTAAQAKLKMDLHAFNAPMLAELVEKQGIVKTSEDNINMYNNFLKQRMSYDEKIRAAELRAAGTGGRGSNQNARFAANMQDAFAQAAVDLDNVTKMPKETILGAFSGMTGQSGKGLIDSLANSFARKITPQDERMFQQIISGLELNMSKALGGGYASSSAKHVVDAYKAQVAASGDSPANKALFLARMKQELNVFSDNYETYPGATPDMIGKVKKYQDIINKAVPFDVKDVLEAENRSKGSFKSFVPGTEKTKKATGFQEGDTSVSKSGKPIIYKNGKWEYQDASAQ
jgi:hypothetical protein